jgi:hypothetical protein
MEQPGSTFSVLSSCATAESYWSRQSTHVLERQRCRHAASCMLYAVCHEVYFCEWGSMSCYAMLCAAGLCTLFTPYGAEKGILTHVYFSGVEFFRACSVMISPPSPITGDSQQSQTCLPNHETKPHQEAIMPSSIGYRALMSLRTIRPAFLAVP